MPTVSVGTDSWTNPLTILGPGLTVRVDVALRPSNVARIAAEPLATAVTTPPAVTVAIEGLSDDHVPPATALDAPLDRRVLRLRVADSPSSRGRTPLMSNPSARMMVVVGGVGEFEQPVANATTIRYAVIESREDISLTFRATRSAF
jgi:hypothetical protein